MNTSSHQSGSAIVLILVAVAMFAALSFAVMRGGAGSTQALTDQQALLAAQEMISFSSTMQKTIHTMRLRGVNETQFDFSNDVYKTLHEIPITLPNGSCTNDICKVFDVNGGAITPFVTASNALILPPSGPNTHKPGHAGFWVLKVGGIGSELPDLLMINAFLKKEVCIKINELLGVENPAGAPPVDSYGNMMVYSDNIVTFPDPVGYGLGDQAPQIVGKSIFCARHGTDYRMWTVLLAR